jgi:hypothetical protein
MNPPEIKCVEQRRKMSDHQVNFLVFLFCEVCWFTVFVAEHGERKKVGKQTEETIECQMGN